MDTRVADRRKGDYVPIAILEIVGRVLVFVVNVRSSAAMRMRMPMLMLIDNCSRRKKNTRSFNMLDNTK